MGSERNVVVDNDDTLKGLESRKEGGPQKVVRIRYSGGAGTEKKCYMVQAPKCSFRRPVVAVGCHG